MEPTEKKANAEHGLLTPDPGRVSQVDPREHQSRGSSPQRTPGRHSTDPSPVRPSIAKMNKRIIICCDGTWQDGLTVSQRWKYTNVLRLARSINHMDERQNPPVPQIVFYQSGVGTENFAPLALFEGAVGASLGDKVQDAYGFLAHNYRPGDEIFLFGFSRGAYTARMVASFIEAIGILDRKDMDHFADLFLALQKRGKTKDEKEKQELDETLKPWTHHNSPGMRHVESDDSFFVKCVGVFDTVGSVGLPNELSFGSEKVKTLFGFPDTVLGPHIERAYHAMALNENRKDFNCTKFHQTERGRGNGQILKQCWFAGSHSDVGGGYEEHDLSDIALFWMAANIGDILSLDMDYLISLPEPVATWGLQSPHDSSTGIFALASSIQRELPAETDNTTHETIHLSVLQQQKQNPKLEQNVKNKPHLVGPLLPLEEEIKALWKVSPEKSRGYQRRKTTQELEHKENGKGDNRVEATQHVLQEEKGSGHGVLKSLTHMKTISAEPGAQVYEENQLLVGKVVHESSIGGLLKDLTGGQ
ncbi:unnamed protein product [Somion occarium]|uniref:T6SS Phospholipase effector Tle1-like catalytic domain-containing protein n=1 Tax=Somion occarium TaxID=3059160 RepID=A0ABP1CM61_9APHY